MRELKEDSIFSKSDSIFIAGNIGVGTIGEFGEYLNGLISIDKDIYYVTGKYEDFALLKDIKDGRTNKRFYFVPPSGIPTHMDISLAGVSGTYSPTFYEKGSAPMRHFTKNQLLSLPSKADVVLLHNIPGRLAKSGSLDFHEDVFRIIDAKKPRYIFIGGYDRFSHFNYHDTTVVFLTSLRKGYALLDTSDWTCFYQHKMV